MSEHTSLHITTKCIREETLCDWVEKSNVLNGKKQNNSMERHNQILLAQWFYIPVQRSFQVEQNCHVLLSFLNVDD